MMVRYRAAVDLQLETKKQLISSGEIGGGEMRIIKLFFCLTLLFLMLAAACSSTKPTKDMGELYSLALDAFMPIDEGLNGNMKYIAIDMTEQLEQKL